MLKVDREAIHTRLCGRDERWSDVFAQLSEARKNRRIKKVVYNKFFECAGRLVIDGAHDLGEDYLPEDMIMVIFWQMDWIEVMNARATNAKFQRIIDRDVIPRIKVVRVTRPSEAHLLEAFMVIDTRFNVETLSFKTTQIPLDRFPFNTVLDEVAVDAIARFAKTVTRFEVQGLMYFPFRKIFEYTPGTENKFPRLSHLSFKPPVLLGINRFESKFSFNRDFLLPPTVTSLEFPYRFTRVVLFMDSTDPTKSSWSFYDPKQYPLDGWTAEEFFRDMDSVQRTGEPPLLNTKMGETAKHAHLFLSGYLDVLASRVTHYFDHAHHSQYGKDLNALFPNCESIILDGPTYNTENIIRARRKYAALHIYALPFPPNCKFFSMPMVDLMNIGLSRTRRVVGVPSITRLCLLEAKNDVRLSPKFSITRSLLRVAPSVSELFVEYTDLFGVSRNPLSNNTTSIKNLHVGPVPMDAMNALESFDFPQVYTRIATTPSITSRSPYRLSVKITEREDLDWEFLDVMIEDIFTMNCTDNLCFWNIDTFADDAYENPSARLIATAIVYRGFSGTIFLVNSQSIIAEIARQNQHSTYTFAVLRASDTNAKVEEGDGIYIRYKTMDLSAWPSASLSNIDGLLDLSSRCTVNGVSVADVMG